MDLDEEEMSDLQASSRPLLPASRRDSTDDSREASDSISNTRKSDGLHHQNEKSSTRNPHPQRLTIALAVCLVVAACILSFILGRASSHSSSLGVEVPHHPALSTPTRSTSSSTTVPPTTKPTFKPKPEVTTPVADAPTLSKPKGVRIVGIMFFGRRKYVDILDCYLRANLAVNGGFLDEVHFIADNVRNEKDRIWLRDLVERSGLQGHYVVKVKDETTRMHWTLMWKTYVSEPNTIYVKIDDDVVFMEKNAIPRIVNTLLTNPNAHNVQANIINCRQNEWFHWHSGAVLPFLPEMKSSWRKSEPKANLRGNVWRHSSLPKWPGDDKLKNSFNWNNKDFKPPFRGHRWLPLDDTPVNLDRTPIAKASNPDETKVIFSHWGLAAQEHYSLFHHLENNSLGAYYWGNKQGVWNPWYKHYDINLMAIRGKTLLKSAFWDWIFSWGDQWALTQKAPKDMHRPYLIDTHAIAAHFSFNPTQKKLLATDILSRYRAYANENVCGPDNQKVSFD